MTDDAKWVRDRMEIEALAVLFCRGNDFDSKYYDLCLTDDVEVEYPGRKWQGLEEQKRRRDMGIGSKCAWTFHHLSNPVIQINGDVGRGEYYINAAHGMNDSDGNPQVVWAGCIYIHDVVRTHLGWRIKKHSCVITWNDVNDYMAQLRGPAPAPAWERVALTSMELMA